MMKILSLLVKAKKSSFEQLQILIRFYKLKTLFLHVMTERSFSRHIYFFNCSNQKFVSVTVISKFVF